MVSTLDFESSDPSSSLGGTSFKLHTPYLLVTDNEGNLPSAKQVGSDSTCPITGRLHFAQFGERQDVGGALSWMCSLHVVLLA